MRCFYCGEIKVKTWSAESAMPICGVCAESHGVRIQDHKPAAGDGPPLGGRLPSLEERDGWGGMSPLLDTWKRSREKLEESARVRANA